MSKASRRLLHIFALAIAIASLSEVGLPVILRGKVCFLCGSLWQVYTCHVSKHLNQPKVACKPEKGKLLQHICPGVC